VPINLLIKQRTEWGHGTDFAQSNDVYNYSVAGKKQHNDVNCNDTQLMNINEVLD